jgi:hypothetical protein
MSDLMAVEVTTGPKMSSSAAKLTTNSKRNVIMGRRSWRDIENQPAE